MDHHKTLGLLCPIGHAPLTLSLAMTQIMKAYPLIFFSASAIEENRQDIAEKFKSLLYKEPALVPRMMWKDAVQADNRKISWALGMVKFVLGQQSW